MTRASRQTAFPPRVERLEDRNAPSVLPLTGDVQVNQGTVNDLGSPVATAPDGHYVIAYHTAGSTKTLGARLFAADGTPLTPEFQVSQDAPDKVLGAAVAMNAQDQFVIAWGSDFPVGGTFQSVIQARRYDAAGNPLGDALQVSQGSAIDVNFPAVAMDAAGNFTIAWEIDVADFSNPLMARRYDSTGTALGNEFVIESGAAAYPAAAMDAAGNFVLAWNHLDDARNDGFTGTIQFQQFDAAGQPLAPPTSVARGLAFPGVALDGAGNFVIAWADGISVPITVQHIKAQRFNSAAVDATTQTTQRRRRRNDGDGATTRTAQRRGRRRGRKQRGRPDDSDGGVATSGPSPGYPRRIRSTLSNPTRNDHDPL